MTALIRRHGRPAGDVWWFLAVLLAVIVMRAGARQDWGSVTSLVSAIAVVGARAW